jgi:hypothetical protein
MAALEAGEDPKADPEMLQEQSNETAGIGISHSAYEIRKWKRVWTAVRKGHGLATDDQTDRSRAANDNGILTDGNRRGDKMTRVINIYD